ncbi:MAG: SDR family NAD(P)-dependent oxidoreductase [Zoogloeaceae bacterium]|nr:SDR family NAD(P)-dependent oxidoreductase [Rhodocyclaceae bacterium]MCP5236312.1 SDR family NAD(P)-dependent oxidoreductase [Zoogloeaceae bacterium]
MDDKRLAIVVGAGPGLGASLARRFARASMNVVMACRHPSRIDTLAAEFSGIGHSVCTRECDACDESSVQALFEWSDERFGAPDIVVYNAGAFVQRPLLETSAGEFEHCWRVGCLGGFLVGREAARSMLQREDRGGAILFTGATASLRGGAGFHNLAVGKFGLRALAQSMARELGPQGIHVAHIVIDGRIRAPAVVEQGSKDGGRLLDPDELAEAYYQLAMQPKSAWTQELDLRPWVERF